MLEISFHSKKKIRIRTRIVVRNIYAHRYKNILNIDMITNIIKKYNATKYK